MPKYKKQSDNRYYAKVWDGTYINNRKHYIRITSSKSSADLEKKVEAYKLNMSEGVSNNTDITLYEYAVNWLKLTKSLKTKNTYSMYEGIINRYLSINLPIKNINYVIVQNIINENANKPRTCQQILLTLKQIIKRAIKDGICAPKTLSAIFDDISTPKYKSAERRPLTDVEKDILFKTDFTDKEKAYVFTLYYCGLRPEEARALSVNDIDLSKNLIYIHRSLTYPDNKIDLKDTKTYITRYVPIPIQLQSILSNYLSELKGTKDFIFKMRGDSCMSKSSYVKFWNSIRNKMTDKYISTLEEGEEFDPSNGFNDLIGYTFRHNYVTKLCYEVMNGNITTKKIASLIGDSEDMVLKVYSHIIEEKENVIEALNNAF